MHIFLNGEIVPEERAVVSVFDRGFLYGDGLFETMRVVRGEPFRWAEHLERLQRGADFLKLKIPFAPARLHASVLQLIARNQMPDSLLRLTLSRGVGSRGYSPKGADKPVLVMTLHPAPAAGITHWKLITASQRVPAGDSLAQFKTCNKLAQILARAEADEAGADEALLLNTKGELAEAASSNVFWIKDGYVHTPPLDAGILPGVTRAVIADICHAAEIPMVEKNAPPKKLLQSDGVFVALSSLGIVEVTALDGATLKTSPLTKEIRAAYQKLLGA